MMMDVILNKKESIERCVQQIRLYYAMPSELSFEKDHLKQDAIAANLQRAAEQVIDLANHVIRKGKLMIDHQIGTGTLASSGKSVVVHYTGWLFDSAALDHKGRKFDSSRDRGEPFGFTLGAGQVIKGWDQGVDGMRVGGQRTLTVPPELGYGTRGAGAVIPPNATLIFDVELLEVD